MKLKCPQCKKVFTRESYQGNARKKYCSDYCRIRTSNQKRKKAQADWQREWWGRYEPGKVKCLVCGKYYHKLGLHTYYRHKLTGRKYRQKFNLEVKRGILSDVSREKHHDLNRLHAEQNDKNLRKGKKFWFKPGDKKAGRYHRSPITIARVRALGKGRRKVV